MRVGIGYDIHAFDPGRPLILGGIKIAGAWGLRGHSDADAVLHAVCDALLGAAALGDIGDHFPDDDPQWEGAPSAVLLAEVLAKLQARGFAPANVDVTVIAERPRLGPQRGAMRERMANLLDLPAEQVNVKATTHEGLGALGRGEGIAALAVASIAQIAESDA